MSLENDTKNWLFDYVFDEYCDVEILEYLMKDKLENDGIWSVKNLLSGIDNDCGIYRIDVYGYGSDISESDLQEIKDNILDIINNELESE